MFQPVVEKLKTPHTETDLRRLLIGLQVATITGNSAFVVHY